MILLLALAGCRSGLAVVSDLHGDRWELVNPYTGRVRYVFDVDGTNVDDCRVQDDARRFCLVYQSRHRIDAEGHDEVAYTYTPVAEEGTDPDALRGRVVGIRPGDPATERWRLDRLDWSGIDPDGARCRWDPADPCQPAPDATEAEVRACQLYWPHDFRVLGEGAEGLSLAIADTRNDRVVWVDHPLDGGTCGRVTEVLDRQHPDWDTYASVNALDVWTEGDGRRMLLTTKDSLPGADPEQVQGDEAGKGKILYWTDDGGGWTQAWEHPPETTERPSFVNAPHGIARDDTRVFFAHALGASEAWETGSGGSVGVLDWTGAYLYDAVPDGEALTYARSVSVLDGALLVVDSGTKGDEHAPAETALLVLELPDDAAPTGRSGAWSADHAEQELRPVPVRSRSVPKDAWVLYSAEVIEVTAGM